MTTLMLFETLDIPEVIKVTPPLFKDNRGEFMETFKKSAFDKAVGREINFAQNNQSLSLKSNTVRGLHFQTPPFAQGKLVRCVTGAILDVAVDARSNSQSYGKWVSAELTEENNCQIWIPEGFLHGFVTLQPNTIVEYKCTHYYAPEYDRAIFWNDKTLNIDWGINPQHAILSDKDSTAPSFCLQHLESQSYKDFEVIIVNNEL